MGGSTDIEGRVEVCIDETWSTVCDNGWLTTEANVVCKQLGFAIRGANILTCIVITSKKTYNQYHLVLRMAQATKCSYIHDSLANYHYRQIDRPLKPPTSNSTCVVYSFFLIIDLIPHACMHYNNY